MALLAIGFLRGLSLVHATSERFRVPNWLKPALGGLALGVLVTPILIVAGGRIGNAGQGFGILGGGYGAVQLAISGASWLPGGWSLVFLLLALAFAKLVAASLTIGSGGSAGDFAPSLAMGGLLGGAFGQTASLLLGDARIDPGAFALVGMGAFYGGIAHVPLAAIVIDDHAYTGGHAWGDEWLPASRGGGGWHDVCCSVRGAVVGDFAALFEEHWRQSVKEAPMSDYVGGLRGGRLQLVSDAPVRESVVLGCYLAAIVGARSRVWLANAYFLPPPRLLDALVEAARRGVDVKIIVPANSDLRVIQHAARARYRRWMEAGLELWEYGGTMMHAKYCVIDDGWCLVGTFNANAVSVALAIEVALMSLDPEDVAGAAHQMQRDLAASERVDETQLERVPRWQRIINGLASMLLTVATFFMQRRPAPASRLQREAQVMSGSSSA